jgi:AGZA family xanthine/uracil permease-like MFS transporter
MPYGPSVPHMFIVTFVIMLPTYLATKDPIKAWEAGLAWAFIIGVIILIGAFVRPVIRRFTPRAALLGTLAGISLTFISMRPAAQMWEATWIALPVVAIIIVGFIGGVRLPGNFPIGLAALLLGSAIAWLGGFMDAGAVSDSVDQIAVGLPSLNVDMLANGLEGISPLLATAMPLGIYNFTEA